MKNNMNKTIKQEIIKILKEGQWKSEYQTYSEVADYIISDALLKEVFIKTEKKTWKEAKSASFGLEKVEFINEW